MTNHIELRNIVKTFTKKKNEEILVLDHVDLDIKKRGVHLLTRPIWLWKVDATKYCGRAGKTI